MTKKPLNSLSSPKFTSADLLTTFFPTAGKRMRSPTEILRNAGGQTARDTKRASSWFRRGWTLQELLAPVGSCERLLLNSKWEVMGGIPSSSGTGPYLGDYDVDSLLSVVSEITGIQEDYLTGSRSIEEASVACRMSWSSNRSATLTEDEAYCLMGIFNVNMPLLYGEGHGAFRRLQEEIIRTSTDQSIFASSYERFLSALDPSDFAGSGNVVTRSHESHRVVKHMPIQPFEMTNLGVRFRAAIRRGRLHGQYQGFRAFQLNCFEMSGAEDTLTPIYLAL
ncbi:Vegetative incompatibility protein HET-E-1 [Pseudocercospora fuligena]|uniref:Vegetative incompatibility protein HET-E-1 n=1 Tax=Pseudocercospora fuligena TaxID=685502 RepID=A0A8H6RN55_9PEZI|nr:Vegetative incompatibility protein HET-E-1 [Pseudocercospora fuligena]